MHRPSLLSIVASLVLLISPAAKAVTANAVRETQKVRPTDPPPATQSAMSLSCAGNEWCAFQVVVSAPSSGTVTVTDITLADLAGPGGAILSGSSALVYTERFMSVTTPSNSAGATGLWPDALVPKVDVFYAETRNAFPAQVAAATNQPFFIEWLIPAGQTPGIYSGAATVTAADGSSAVISVSAQVRGFSLPATSSLTTAYGFDWDGPCVGHFGGYGPPDCDDQQLEALNALYFTDALNHRLTISQVVYAPPLKDGVGSWTTFDSLYGPLLEGKALGGPQELAGAALTSIEYTDDLEAASYAGWMAQFAAMGWQNTLFDYTCDEPPKGCAWSTIPTRAATVHAGSASFKTLVTTTLQNAQTNGVLSSINILVPIINEMDSGTNERSTYDSFLETPGNEVWMYQSCEPSSSCTAGVEGGQTGWPTMFIDESAISNRIMQWMDFNYQVSGELYYDTTYAMDTQANSWVSQYEFGNNGDGSIWYPGKPSIIGGTHDIPIESFRMKMIREGLQDYEYLHMLDQLGDGAFARSALASVVTAAYNYQSDPAILEQARLDMAAEIESDLGTALQTGGADAGVPPTDAGVSAGGTPDAGAREDAGTPAADAGVSAGGTPDAGAREDAGTPAADAGESSRGTPDAGPPLDVDAGPPPPPPTESDDAGLADAGRVSGATLDAGAPVDAGSPFEGVDAGGADADDAGDPPVQDAMDSGAPPDAGASSGEGPPSESADAGGSVSDDAGDGSADAGMDSAVTLDAGTALDAGSSSDTSPDAALQALDGGAGDKAGSDTGAVDAGNGALTHSHPPSCACGSASPFEGGLPFGHVVLLSLFARLQQRRRKRRESV